MGEPAKKIEIIQDIYSVSSMLREIKETRQKIYLWQILDKAGKRKVHLADVKIINSEKLLFDIRPPRDGVFRLNHPSILFFYAPSFSIGFSASVKEYDQKSIIVHYPEKMNKLLGQAAASLKLVEDENEEQFIHLRSDLRKEAQGEQYVTIVRKTGSCVGESGEYILADMSSNGMGMITFDPGEFSIGEIIHVSEINGKEISKVLIGEVVSVRKKDDSLDEFKVGVKLCG